jgi:hypothetical protein
MNAFFSFDLLWFIKQQPRTMKEYTRIRDIAYFESVLYLYYSQKAAVERTREIALAFNSENRGMHDL